MIAILRLAIFGFVAMTVLYVTISIYSRSVRREKLEKQFDSGDVEPGDVEMGRDAYIEAGMDAYRHGLRRQLIWLVYVIPTIVVAATVYFVNYQ